MSSSASPARRPSTVSIATTASNATEKQQQYEQQQQQQSTRQSQLIQQPGTGLRLPSNRKTIYDRHLNRSRNAELSRASFAYIFAEMVTYAQRRVTGIQDLERR